MSGALSIWTVYDRPIDFPGLYVARRTEIRRSVSRSGINRSVIASTDDVWTSHGLDALRAVLARMGLTRLDRNPADDPVIVEVWL